MTGPIPFVYAELSGFLFTFWLHLIFGLQNETYNMHNKYRLLNQENVTGLIEVLSSFNFLPSVFTFRV